MAGFLSLGNLVNVENLTLPDTVGGDVHLSSLTSAQELIIPDPLHYIIYMDGFYITKENVDQYRKSNKSK